MRYSFKCPKCASTNVVEVIGHNMNTMQKIPLQKWNLKFAVLDRYICTQCGYTEEYVQLSEGFKKWAAKELGNVRRGYDDYV